MNEHGAESVLREFLPIYSLFTRKYMLGTFLSIHENTLQKRARSAYCQEKRPSIRKLRVYREGVSCQTQVIQCKSDKVQ